MYADPDPASEYEPGANSEQIGEELLEALDRASLAQPPGSTLRKKFDARYDYVNNAVLHQDQFMGDIGWPAWWSDVGPDPPSLSVQKNNTLSAEEGASNKSSDGASGVELTIAGCNVDSKGSRLIQCGTSTSRRSVKRFRRMTKA